MVPVMIIRVIKIEVQIIIVFCDDFDFVCVNHTNMIANVIQKIKSIIKEDNL